MSIILRSTLAVGAVVVTSAIIRASRAPGRLSEEETQNLTNRVRERTEENFRQKREESEKRAQAPQQEFKASAQEFKASASESETKK